MSLAEMTGQHVGSLTDDFNVLHHGVVDADVGHELLIGDASDYLLHVLGVFQNVLQPPTVSAMLSHKSIFCHG